MSIRRTHLEKWISRKIGGETELLNRGQIESYQLQRLRETIHNASLHSPFYRDLWADTDLQIDALHDLTRFPFTAAGQIREHSLRFLCVSQDDISRAVTLDTSGTTGNPKRLYFTPSDQELTIDFFQHGMSALVESGDRVLILLPGERPGSVGDLLASALKRAGVIPVPHGVVGSIPETLKIMQREKIDSVVGIPVQVLALARYSKIAGMNLSLKSLLLSTDNVPDVIKRELKRVWGCRVFDHYGMTEMGLGGGVECEAHHGYHLREADLYFEIVDDKGQPAADGQKGEVVFTTLTRQGMPLVRYRTGDISRFITEQCECGTVLRRLEKITGRINGLISIDGKRRFSMPDLDEALFELPGIVNFEASVDSASRAKKLMIKALTSDESGKPAENHISRALDRIPAMRDARSEGILEIFIEMEKCGDTLPPPIGKRSIKELI